MPPFPLTPNPLECVIAPYLEHIEDLKRRAYETEDTWKQRINTAGISLSTSQWDELVPKPGESNEQWRDRLHDNVRSPLEIILAPFVAHAGCFADLAQRASETKGTWQCRINPGGVRFLDRQYTSLEKKAGESEDAWKRRLLDLQRRTAKKRNRPPAPETSVIKKQKKNRKLASSHIEIKAPDPAPRLMRQNTVFPYEIDFDAPSIFVAQSPARAALVSEAGPSSYPLLRLPVNPLPDTSSPYITHSLPSNPSPPPANLLARDSLPAQPSLFSESDPRFPRLSLTPPPRGSTPTNPEMIQSESPPELELQVSSCASYRKTSSPDFSLCFSCVSRQSDSDDCCFRGIRHIVRGPRGGISGVVFTKIPKTEPDLDISMPTEWNIPLTGDHKRLVRSTAAYMLLSILEREIAHITPLETTIYRPRETDCRSTCDLCLTSTFSETSICRTCGREVCRSCLRLVTDLTGQVEDIRRITKCRSNIRHNSKSFSPITRFTLTELQRTVAEMRRAVHCHLPEPTAFTCAQELGDALAGDSAYHRGILRFQPNHISLDPTFKAVWFTGQPIVITGMLDRLKLTWTPDFFIENYGSAKVTVMDCQSDQEAGEMDVRTFFRQFGQPRDSQTPALKLRDWPPSSSFKEVFPELYDDFSNAVPFPDYVRRDGVLNMSSHFPTKLVPDLGPKMYNAFATSTSQGSLGSTRLHMDMADAINIMTYASQQSDGSAGCAAWDLFRRKDSVHLRRFMMTHFKTTVDPIHSQEYYLSDNLLLLLYKEYGVKSYRVYQHPGEAVFIPAGCAHQVANLADCIKVAMDFVTPESIEACEQLTEEFRALNISEAWKEDVLQLRSMMWWAWRSCSVA